MRVSRNDVAKEAGVSPSTVSLILNGKTKYFNPNTIERVKNVAKNMGYTPNRIAKALKTGKSNIVTLWVNHITAPFTSEVINSIQKYLYEKDYDLLVKEIYRDEQISEEIYSDAVIAYDCDYYIRKYMEKYPQSVPIISAGVDYDPKLDNVTFDFSTGFNDAFNSLVDLGCTKIAYFAPMQDNKGKRHMLYKANIKKHKFKEFSIFHENTVNYETVMKSLMECEFLKELDGIYSYNDHNSMILIRCLYDLGINVPGDIKLISTDNIPSGAYFVPTLSTVDLPVDEICKTCVEFMINRLEHPKLKIQKGVFSSKFIARESSE